MLSCHDAEKKRVYTCAVVYRSLTNQSARRSQLFYNFKYIFPSSKNKRAETIISGWFSLYLLYCSWRLHYTHYHNDVSLIANFISKLRLSSLPPSGVWLALTGKRKRKLVSYSKTIPGKWNLCCWVPQRSGFAFLSRMCRTLIDRLKMKTETSWWHDNFT